MLQDRIIYRLNIISITEISEADKLYFYITEHLKNIKLITK
jgi:hypothetical protein